MAGARLSYRNDTNQQIKQVKTIAGFQIDKRWLTKVLSRNVQKASRRFIQIGFDLLGGQPAGIYWLGLCSLSQP